MTRPRAVLFDWDSTLIDNWRSIETALNATLVAMGHAPWTSEETRARVRVSMRDSFPHLFGSRWEEAKRIFYDSINACHLEYLTPLPGAAEMLHELAGSGLYLGVVSNKTGSILRREAAHLGWDHLFGRVIGAGDAKWDKPDPAPIFMALEGAGVSPSAAVWFVGDTALDVDCARNANCTSILIAGQGQGRDDFSSSRPDYEVLNCLELSALVRRA
ncbi:MAG TPA: HAD family hydrolase [Alphaproteobacteria bacterium]|nr:HAD family hydrolase [Alphaproteobacteria bacterium]